MRSLIDDGGLHVFDGAMGTVLYQRGVFVNICYDELNLTRPDLVREIHAEYVTAGAEIIETNTFGANPIKLSAYGLEERTEEINRIAATLAKEAASPGGAQVAGALGPLGIRVEPYGPTGLDEATELFDRQVAGLLEGGVDGFVLETFSDLAELRCALRAVRTASDLPVVAQMTVGRDGKTSYGADAARIAQELESAGADVIGLNCSVGPAVMLDALEEMAEVTSRPLVAQPNAGLPRNVRDRKIYLASPEYMATYASRLVDAGARFVGGCCGTTPEHITKIRAALGTARPRHLTGTVVAARERSSAERDPVPLEERSALGAKLACGERVTMVEILPPDGWDTAPLVEPARHLAEAGVDAVGLVESPRFRSRMGALSAGVIVQRDVGMEVLVHYTCRDKNMLGMIADLLGAAAAGLRNILVVTGDPPVTGPYPEPTAVFDIDSIGLTNVVQGLNRGVDPGAHEIGAPTRFVQGVAVNQAAIDLDREISRFHYKVDAGADFAITQPVFDVEVLERFLEAAGPVEIPMIAGAYPLFSLRNAEFLANELPGVSVPAETVDRMARAQQSGAEAALEEGTRIAIESIEAALPLVQGVHLSAPRRQVEIATTVLRESGLL